MSSKAGTYELVSMRRKTKLRNPTSFSSSSSDLDSSDTSASSNDVEDGWDFIETSDAQVASIRTSSSESTCAYTEPPSRLSASTSDLDSLVSNSPTSSSSTGGFKSRVYCALYNIYHSLPTEPPPFSDEPIWMMGKEFTQSAEEQKNQRTQGKKQKKKVPEHAERFMQAFSQIVYFSYRKDFPRLNYFNSTTDVGWGCMLRTGQMMLARALMLAESGTSASVRGGPYALERKILRLFSDHPNAEHPYSIHNIVNRNVQCYGLEKKDEEKNGIWFSPTKIAKVLRYLVKNYQPGSLTMYVSSDGSVYIDKILSLCTRPEKVRRRQPGSPPEPEYIWNITRTATPPKYYRWYQPAQNGTTLTASKPTKAKTRRRSSASLHDTKEKLRFSSTDDDFVFVGTGDSWHPLRSSDCSAASSINEQTTLLSFSMSDSTPPASPRDLSKNSESKLNSTTTCSYWSIKFVGAKDSQQTQPAMANSTPRNQSSTTDSSTSNNEQSQNSPPTWRPILIIVPTRLGVSKINPIYFPQLKAILRNKFSVGIAGGKPKQSLYFVAYQGDDVFYLDPHFVRTAVKPDDKWTEEVYQSYHLRIPQKMPFSQMDPSMALGFLCRSLEEFEEFCNLHEQMLKDDSSGVPIFTIQQQAPRVTTKSNAENCMLNCSFVDL